MVHALQMSYHNTIEISEIESLANDILAVFYMEERDCHRENALSKLSSCCPQHAANTAPVSIHVNLSRILKINTCVGMAYSHS